MSPWIEPRRHASWMDRKLEPPPETKTASFFRLIPLLKSSLSEARNSILSLLFLHWNTFPDNALCEIEGQALKETHFWDWAKEAEEEERGNFTKTWVLVFWIGGVEQNPESRRWASIERMRGNAAINWITEYNEKQNLWSQKTCTNVLEEAEEFKCEKRLWFCKRLPVPAFSFRRWIEAGERLALLVFIPFLTFVLICLFFFFFVVTFWYVGKASYWIMAQPILEPCILFGLVLEGC